MKPAAKLYEFHVANLRSVGDALMRVSLAARRAIATGDERTTSALLRTYALLLAAWAECRLRKLLYEPSAFSGPEQKWILSKPTELERWGSSVEVAFRKHYGVPRAPLSQQSLPHSAYARFASINDLMATDLAPVILLRNKLAHGQWAFPLNDDGDDVAQPQFDALRAENLLTLQFKMALLTSLAAILNDLAVSRPAFERDFDRHYSLIAQTRINLRTRSYGQYESSLRLKLHQGRARQSAA